MPHDDDGVQGRQARGQPRHHLGACLRGNLPPQEASLGPQCLCKRSPAGDDQPRDRGEDSENGVGPEIDGGVTRAQHLG